MNSHSASYERVTSLFAVGIVMGFFVEDVSLYGEQIFRPLLFNVDQSSLPTAERKML